MMGWHCGAATQRAGVQRCACIGPLLPLRVHLSSPLRLSVHAYSERETGWRGGVGAPNLRYPVVPIKDVSERCTSLEIVYATWHTCAPSVWRCDVCMPFDTSDGPRYTLNVRPLTLKLTLHLYDLLWTCCWCAVLDLVFVQNCERRRFG